MFTFFHIFLGKHIPIKDEEKRKAYPRQMIIPNKFIPMLKESALFKSRSSSNDLSDFLKPKSHDDVTGKTRQNLMNAMAMDGGQEEGGMGAGSMGPGGIGQGGMDPGGGMPGMAAMGGGTPGMAALGGGTPGMAAMGGSEGMGSEAGMREGGGLEGLAKMAGGMGGLGGMNDQMSAMNGMGGMPNSEGGGNPSEGLMGGNNAMNPMNNAGPEGMMSDSNQLPAGDPMGTLKSMLDNQGTNAALGTNAEAFGPGGSANANVLAMLNQIVGKEMPGESPIDPSSKSQQMWDQLQKGLSNQRAAVQPYIDSSESKIPPAPAQQDAPSNPAPTNNRASAASPTSTHSGINNQTAATPVYNLTSLSKASPSSNQKILNQPKGDSVTNAPLHTPDAPVHIPETKVTSSTSKTAEANIKSQAATHENDMTKTSSNPAAIDLDDDQPLSDDMVKFLKGIKFVVSQEPGNDIILGKKFTSDVPPVSTSFKEENGMMKNVVSEKHKDGKGKNEISVNKENNNEAAAVVKVLKGIDLSYARNLLLRRNVNNEDFAEYQRAAKVLERASRKLNDPIAKKSTEIAIASILKVLELRNKKKTTPVPTKDLLTGGDVKSALSEKYFEAARVLGTASKKLADPVAKKSAEIGIASILKVSALGNYSLSKKNLVPLSHDHNDAAEMYFNTSGVNCKKYLIAADEIAHKLAVVPNFERIN